MSRRSGRLKRLPGRASWLVLLALLLAASCGGGGEATPSPSASPSASPQMLPIVTPTPGVPASPSPRGTGKESPGG
jgi:hypothetical protein